MQFVFYDTETTGTNRDFDQVLQFAAILTDETLEELDRFEIRCGLLPWVIPAPMALAVTGVRPALLEDASLPSFYDMMGEIRSRLTGWGPSVYVGYNSMRFDEPMMQRAFWQALHPPYLTVTNGNARMDLLPLVKAAAYLHDGALLYPLGENGRRGFRLDQLAPLNGFAHERAHDALGDVEATLHMAKRLSMRCGALWENAARRAAKPAMAGLLAFGEPVLVADYFAAPAPWWGQRIDSAGVSASTASLARLGEDWSAHGVLDSEALGKILSASPRPVRELGLNKSPMVLSREEALDYGFEPDEAALRQSERLRSDPAFCQRLVQTAEQVKEPWPEPVALEQRIFEGFPSREDEALCERFHRSDWLARAALIREFEDPRLAQIAQRLVYDHDPLLLGDGDPERLTSAIGERLHADHGDRTLWRTLGAARLELEEVRGRIDGDALALETSQWLDRVSARFPVPDT